jgi:hypothetical protein
MVDELADAGKSVLMRFNQELGCLFHITHLYAKQINGHAILDSWINSSSILKFSDITSNDINKNAYY